MMSTQNVYNVTEYSVEVVFILFLIAVAVFILLIPPMENPDELLHINAAIRTNDLEVFNPLTLSDGNLYYFITGKISHLFNFDKVMFSMISNRNFKYFSDSLRYKLNYKNSAVVYFFRFSNIMYIFLFYMIYRLFYKSQIMDNILKVSLLFPGFIYFFSIYNPDVLNVLFAFLFWAIYFKNIKYRNFLLTMLTILMIFFCDRSIYIFIATLFFYYIYSHIFKFNKIFYMVAIIFALLARNFLKYYYHYYLSFSFEPIKSVVTASISFYGLLGNMSIRLPFFSYLTWLLFLLYLFFFIVTSRDNIKHIIFFYIILWFSVLTLVPTLDQGRYFYPISFVLFYFIVKFLKQKGVILQDIYVYVSMVPIFYLIVKMYLIIILQ